MKSPSRTTESSSQATDKKRKVTDNQIYGNYKESVKFGKNVFLHSKVNTGGKQMKEKLLLIEDDAAIGRIVKYTLEQEGYQITWATTGLEGLADFQADTFDLVLVDWMLPEMDGLTVCQNIRWESDVPILMMSARKEEADKVEGLQGADDYIAKPFSLEELKARVASHLRRWKRYTKKQITEDVTCFAHGLNIDWQKETVRLDEKELALTQKEFALLKLYLPAFSVLAIQNQSTLKEGLNHLLQTTFFLVHLNGKSTFNVISPDEMLHLTLPGKRTATPTV